MLTIVLSRTDFPKPEKSNFKLTICFFLVVISVALANLGAIALYRWLDMGDLANKLYHWPATIIAISMVLFLTGFGYKLLKIKAINDLIDEFDEQYNSGLSEIYKP